MELRLQTLHVRAAAPSAVTSVDITGERRSGDASTASHRTAAAVGDIVRAAFVACKAVAEGDAAAPLCMDAEQIELACVHAVGVAA